MISTRHKITYVKKLLWLLVLLVSWPSCAPAPVAHEQRRSSQMSPTSSRLGGQGDTKELEKLGSKPNIQIDFSTTTNGVNLGELGLMYPGLKRYVERKGKSCNNYYVQYESCPSGVAAHAPECGVGGQRGLTLEELSKPENKVFIWDVVIEKQKLDFHFRICQLCQKKEACSSWQTHSQAFQVAEHTQESYSLAQDFKRLDYLEYEIRILVKKLYQGLTQQEKKSATMEDIVESFLAFDFNDIPKDIIDEGLAKLTQILSNTEIRDANTVIDDLASKQSCIEDITVCSSTQYPCIDELDLPCDSTQSESCFCRKLLQWQWKEENSIEENESCQNQRTQRQESILQSPPSYTEKFCTRDLVCLNEENTECQTTDQNCQCKVLEETEKDSDKDSFANDLGWGLIATTLTVGLGSAGYQVYKNKKLLDHLANLQKQGLNDDAIKKLTEASGLDIDPKRLKSSKFKESLKAAFMGKAHIKGKPNRRFGAMLGTFIIVVNIGRAIAKGLDAPKEFQGIATTIAMGLTGSAIVYGLYKMNTTPFKNAIKEASDAAAKEAAEKAAKEASGAAADAALKIDQSKLSNLMTRRNMAIRNTRAVKMGVGAIVIGAGILCSQGVICLTENSEEVTGVRRDIFLKLVQYIHLTKLLVSKDTVFRFVDEEE